MPPTSTPKSNTKALAFPVIEFLPGYDEMTEPLSRDKTSTGDTLRVSGAKMFSSHGPGNACSVMVLHWVSRQHFSALARAVNARRYAQEVASILIIEWSEGGLDGYRDE
jgi:hypothetical protein